ncbi:MAG: TCP-1/cpn60 chaperonin family protein, partial [Thermodesulfobacteriota bacterium]
LLKEAEKLMDMGIHPTSIIKGYNIAMEKAQDILQKNSIKCENGEILKKNSSDGHDRQRRGRTQRTSCRYYCRSYQKCWER